MNKKEPAEKGYQPCHRTARPGTVILDWLYFCIGFALGFVVPVSEVAAAVDSDSGRKLPCLTGKHKANSRALRVGWKRDQRQRCR